MRRRARCHWSRSTLMRPSRSAGGSSGSTTMPPDGSVPTKCVTRCRKAGRFSSRSAAPRCSTAAIPDRVVTVIADALNAHPEVKGIVGLFSYSAPAALEAMQKVGRAGQLKVVGFDESDQTQAAIGAGAIHSSILQDSYRAGYEAIEVLSAEARGQEPGPAEQSPILNVGIDVLTAKNLSDLRSAG